MREPSQFPLSPQSGQDSRAPQALRLTRARHLAALTAALAAVTPLAHAQGTLSQATLSQTTLAQTSLTQATLDQAALAQAAATQATDTQTADTQTADTQTADIQATAAQTVAAQTMVAQATVAQAADPQPLLAQAAPITPSIPVSTLSTPAVTVPATTTPATTTPATITPAITTPTTATPATGTAPVPAGTLAGVSVTGVPDLLGSYIKATLSVQPGVSVTGINLRQVEQDALASGYLRSAAASLQTVGGQTFVVVAAVANPTIRSVNVSGLTFLPADGFKASLANVLNVAPGATLNTARVEQSKTALIQNFRAEGYPFDPRITTEAKLNTDGTADLNYTVDETAPVTRVEITGSTLLPQATIVAAFKPLYDDKKFTPQAYFSGVQQIQQAYQSAGYLASGINPATTSLEGGVLKIGVVEGKIASVDTSNLTLPAGASVPTLQTRAGVTPVLSVLQADVRTLSNLTGSSVGFALQPVSGNPGQVTVYFGSAEAVSGPVRSIRFVGNTALPASALTAAIRTRPGDVFSRQLAESDFLAIRNAYRKAGFDISTRDPITFEGGVLTFNVREARIAGYQLQWSGERRTQPRVISRELPDAGTLYNDRTFREALDRVNRLGFISVTGVSTKAANPQDPEDLTYVLTLSESGSTRSLPVGLSYDTINGFSGSAGFEFNNVFGLGNTFSINAGASTNDAGQVFYGNVGYTIPWLDIDFADFRRTRTSVSVNAGSNVSGNSTLYTDSSATTSTGRQYTYRTTGFGVEVGRALGRSLSVGLSSNYAYNTYYLEPIESGESSSYGDAAATALLPETSNTLLSGVNLRFDNTVTPDFPTGGLRANVYAGYGFGATTSSALGWTRLEAGASTYRGFGQTLEKGVGVPQKQQAFAVRLNAGTISGTAPAAQYFTIGYSNANPAYELRGYDVGAFKGNNYVTSSAEYRYDFGLDNSVAQTLYGIAFVDAGTAWYTGSTPQLAYSFGLGAQVNLGFNGTPLAVVRLDYGFAPLTGSSKFHFRLGPVW